MKTIRICFVSICLCFLLLEHSACKAQSSIVGSFPAAAVENSLIRFGDNLIVVYSESADQGYFHLLHNLNNGSPVRSFDLPLGLSVKDFKILDGRVYFVGKLLCDDAGSKAGYFATFGFFDINDVFYSGGIVSYSKIDIYNIIDDNTTLDFTSLNKMEVYDYAGISHIIAVGELEDTRGTPLSGNLTTCLMDIQIDPSNYMFFNIDFISSGTGFGLGVFFDVALTDNFVVSIAHKGVPYDFSVGGNMMAMSFARNGSPLSGSLGEYVDNRNINGSMVAVGMRDDQFAVTYSTNKPMGSYNQQQEIALFKINSIGAFLNYNTYKSPTLSGMVYRSYYEMDYNNTTAHLCELSNSTLSGDKEIGVVDPGFVSIDKVYFTDFKVNSVCKTNSPSMLVSGKNASSSILYVGKFDTPLVNTKCKNSNSMPLDTSEIFNLPLNKVSKVSHSSICRSHTPNVVINTFSVICDG